MPSKNTGMVSQSVPITDDRVDLVSRDWFRLFFYLWLITGSGKSTMTLNEVQAGPPTADLLAQVLVHATALQDLQAGPPTADLLAQVLVHATALQDLQVVPPAQPPFVPVAKNTVNLNFPNTLAQSSSDLTVSMPGAVDGDVVWVGVQNACTLTNSCYTGWVSAADTVTIRFNNYSSAAQDPAAGNFIVVVMRNF